MLDCTDEDIQQHTASNYSGYVFVSCILWQARQGDCSSAHPGILRSLGVLELAKRGVRALIVRIWCPAIRRVRRRIIIASWIRISPALCMSVTERATLQSVTSTASVSASALRAMVMVIRVGALVRGQAWLQSDTPVLGFLRLVVR